MVVYAPASTLMFVSASTQSSPSPDSEFDSLPWGRGYIKTLGSRSSIPSSLPALLTLNESRFLAEGMARSRQEILANVN